MKSGRRPKAPVFHKERGYRGSITVETAFVLPLFIFSMLLIMDLFTMLGFYMSVDRALNIEAKKLAKEKDPTLMTKEEFFARVDAAKNGPSYELQEGETIEDLLKRIG